MKLNELDFGYGGAALKQLFTGGARGRLSAQAKRGQDIYTNRLVGGASNAIASEIKAGLVDPKAPMISVAQPEAQPAAQPEAQPATQPEAQPAAQSTTQRPPAWQRAQTPAPLKALDPNADPDARVAPGTKAAAPTQKSAMTHTLNPPDVSSSQIGRTGMKSPLYPVTNPGGANAGRKITTHQATPNNPNQQPALRGKPGTKAIAPPDPNLQTVGGRKMDANALLAKSAKNAAAKASTGMPGEPAAGKPKTQKESTFNKLNQLLESIIEADGAAPYQAQSIYDFLKKQWLPKFFKGQEINLNDQHIDKLIQNVQTSWEKDQGEAALTQLAHAVIGSAPWPEDQQQGGGYGGYGGGLGPQATWPADPPSDPMEKEKLAISMLASLPAKQIDHAARLAKASQFKASKRSRQ